MKKFLLFIAVALLFTLCLVSCGDKTPTYTVTFDTDGANDIASVTVKSGEAVAEPTAPSKDYAEFLGWYVGKVKYDFSTPVTGDITITAKWERNEYRVKFDTAGGNIIDRVKVLGGDPVERPEDPVRENYVFVGWYIGSTEYDFSTPVTSEITLMARWKVQEFTVSFNTNGGSEIASKSVEVLKTVDEPEAPTKDGYLFLGWYVGKTKYDFSTQITSDVTITAKWRYIVPDDTKVYNKMQSVLLLGQSNMVGGADLGSVDPITDDRLFMMRNGTWVPMQEPIHVNGKIGLGASFGKAFVESFDVNLGLIPAAKSGTTLADWAVGGELYENAVSMARIALQSSDICAILWHQGEGNQSTPDYAAKLKVILDSMMKDLGLDPGKIVIITGELFGTRSDLVHGPQLKLLEDYYENYGIAQSDGLTVYDVTTHFDGPSLRVFGYRYFAIFYNIITGKEYIYDDNPDNYRKQ